MVDFTHFQAGTDESYWAESPRLAALQSLAVPHGVRLVVLVAHPDDETLAAGGLIHAVLANGGRVQVIVATAGEHSHPRSPTWSPADLARARAEELPAALAHLGVGVELHLLGHEDGRATDFEAEILTAVSTLADGTAAGDAPLWVAAPWRHDAHTDHEAVGRVAAEFAAARGATLLELPIWFWHWGDDRDPSIDWQRLRRLPLDLAAASAKRAAMAEHVTQIAPLSPAPGDEAILSPAMLAHFARPYEVFVVSIPPTR